MDVFCLPSSYYLLLWSFQEQLILHTNHLLEAKGTERRKEKCTRQFHHSINRCLTMNTFKDATKKRVAFMLAFSPCVAVSVAMRHVSAAWTSSAAAALDPSLNFTSISG